MKSVKRSTKKGAKPKKSQNESSRTSEESPPEDHPSTSPMPSRKPGRKTTASQNKPTSKKIQQSTRILQPTNDRIKKMDKKSKSIKAKTPKSTNTLTTVGSRTSSWLKSNLLKKPVKSPIHLNKSEENFVHIRSSELQFTNIHGIQMARLPIFKDGHQSGVIKLMPHSRKEPRKTSNEIEFVLLFGNVTLLTSDAEHTFEEGTYFIVPKGCAYGLENKSKTTECLMHFHTKT